MCRKLDKTVHAQIKKEESDALTRFYWSIVTIENAYEASLSLFFIAFFQSVAPYGKKSPASFTY